VPYPRSKLPSPLRLAGRLPCFGGKSARIPSTTSDLRINQTLPIVAVFPAICPDRSTLSSSYRLDWRIGRDLHPGAIKCTDDREFFHPSGKRNKQRRRAIQKQTLKSRTLSEHLCKFPVAGGDHVSCNLQIKPESERDETVIGT
jgi:hypothetical protein